MNNKGQSETGILLTIVSFQLCIIVFLGFINVNYESSSVTIADIGFFPNIVNNIAALGWANIIIFSPLIITISYIGLRLLRGGG